MIPSCTPLPLSGIGREVRTSQSKTLQNLNFLHLPETGKERDRESGLDYYPARYRDADVGYWISPDAARQFPNLYGYGANPLNSVDLDGNIEVPDDFKGKLGKDDWYKSSGPSAEQFDRLSLFRLDSDHWASLQSVSVTGYEPLLGKEPVIYANVVLMSEITAKSITFDAGTTFSLTLFPSEGNGTWQASNAPDVPLIGGLLKSGSLSFNAFSAYDMPNRMFGGQKRTISIGNIDVNCFGVTATSVAPWIEISSQPRINGGKGTAAEKRKP